MRTSWARPRRRAPTTTRRTRDPLLAGLIVVGLSSNFLLETGIPRIWQSSVVYVIATSSLLCCNHLYL